MRRILISLAVLLTVWLLVADSAFAGRRHRGRCCGNESNSASACGCERTSCCQPSVQHHKPVAAPAKVPEAPPPEVKPEATPPAPARTRAREVGG